MPHVPIISLFVLRVSSYTDMYYYINAAKYERKFQSDLLGKHYNGLNINIHCIILIVLLSLVVVLLKRQLLSSAPPIKKNRICILYFMQTTFFSFKLEDSWRNEKFDQCSSKTKGSIYKFNHMNMYPFTTVVDLPEIGCLMKVSIILCSIFCRYCVFTWDGRVLNLLRIFHNRIP